MKGQDKYSRMIDDLMILEPLESRYANQPKKAPPKVTLNIDHTKETIYGQDIDRFMRDAMRDNPIDKMVKLITQRHAIQQSINTLLPKMTKDEVTEVYHTLYRIAQKVNEREVLGR